MKITAVVEDFNPSWIAAANSISYGIILLCIILCFTYSQKLIDIVQYHSSPVDWCEENYKVHPWVTEFWNTVSSFALCLVGYIGFMMRILPQDKTEMSTTLAYIILGVIGLGSAYFHGTLSILGQILDEMSILWLVVYILLLIIPLSDTLHAQDIIGKQNGIDSAMESDRIRRLKRIKTLLKIKNLKSVAAAFVFATLMIGIFSPVLSHVVVLSLMPLGISRILATYKTYKSFKKSSATEDKGTVYFKASLKCLALAIFCWLLDKFCCDQIRYVESKLGIIIELHAAWHVLVAVFAYLMSKFCADFMEEDFLRLSKKHDLLQKTKPVLPTKQ